MPFIEKGIPCSQNRDTCCHDCELHFPDCESLVQHLISTHNDEPQERPYRCSICFRDFRSKQSFLQHLKQKPSHRRDLHLAACKGNSQFVAELMRTEYADETGNSHQRTNSLINEEQIGFTPMHCAAFGGHKDCLNMMLDWEDGDPNVKDPTDGRTPVHIAAWKGNAECLQILLHHGGDAELTDNEGKTALDLATPECREVITGHLDYAPSPALPYEILARGPEAVKAFNRALNKEEARVSRMQLAVIGDIGAGKTSLVRALSGEQFDEERHETHGIDRSMVEMTELDSSWNVVDLKNNSHVDEILADRVSEDIKSSNFLDSSRLSSPQDTTPYTPSEGTTEVFNDVAAQNLNQFNFSGPQAEEVDQGTGEPASDYALGSEKKGEENEISRMMPLDKIVRNLSLENPKEKDFQLYPKISIWDFAGHPLYETMHHIFLNSRSFYLVVFSLVKFKDNESGTLETLRFWLNSVRVHTPRSTPMFLVGTHRDQVQDEDVSRAEKVTHEAFAEEFGQHLVSSKARGNCYLFAVDNSRGSEDDGVVTLKQAINKEAKHMEKKLPIRWLHFEEKILGLQSTDTPRCMSKENVRTSMTSGKTDLMSESEFDSMLQFFHDSGVVILPEALFGLSSLDNLKPLVVLHPQYLVDVMTRLHDIENQMQENRQFRDQWNTLKKEGLATVELLEVAWKDFETSVKDLVGILQAAGLLCPVQVPSPGARLEKSPIESNSIHSNVDSTDSSSETPSVRTFVVPFHLAERDLQGKWKKNCRKKWKEICAADKVLIFDFQNFLPPALFNYLLVRVTEESERTHGMQPIMARNMGIFSFGDKFFLLLKRVGKYNQVQVNIRHRHGENLNDVFTALNAIMTDICKQYFKYLKITLGPPCPNPSCPGASVQGKVLEPVSSSESEEEEEEEYSSPVKGVMDTDQRQHVISIDPRCPGKPLWCNSDPLHQFQEIKQWFCDQAVGVPIIAKEKQLCATRTAQPVEACCLVVTSEKMSCDWKKVGRCLKVGEHTIKNIQTDHHGNQQEQAYQLLDKWMTTNGPEATRKALTKALLASNRRDIVEDVKQHYEDEHVEE